MDRDTDRWVRSAEAQAKFRELLDEVNGAHAFIYILRYDRPEAVLVPVEWFEATQTRAEALEAYARQNADVHRENMRLRDELAALETRSDETDT